MTFKKNQSGNPRGRPAGAANKITQAAKEALELAFEGIGGVDTLTQWAKDNQGEFYKLYVRLLPLRTQLSGEDGGPVEFRDLSDGELANRTRQALTSPETLRILQEIGLKPTDNT